MEDNIASIRTFCDAMPDRVLHQRLQQKARHLRLLRLRIDLESDHQARTEPHLLQRQIFLRDCNLLLQGDLVRIRGLERATQQVRQSRDHLGGNAWLIVQHQGRNRIQRVEQEVRLQLIAEGAHLCLPRHHLQRLKPAPLFFKRMVVRNSKVKKSPCCEDETTAERVRKYVAQVKWLFGAA